MSNITTFSELRKLIKNTQWLEMKFTKDEVYNQFNLTKDQVERGTIFEQPNKEVEEYIFRKHALQTLHSNQHQIFYQQEQDHFENHE